MRRIRPSVMADCCLARGSLFFNPLNCLHRSIEDLLLTSIRESGLSSILKVCAMHSRVALRFAAFRLDGSTFSMMKLTFSKCLGKCLKDSNLLELVELLHEWIILNSDGDKVRDVAFLHQRLLSVGGWDHCCFDGRFCIRHVSHK